jgi:hypothetical protein
MADLFDRETFVETLRKELKDNLFPLIVEEAIAMSREHLNILIGNRFEIESKVDRDVPEGYVVGVGAEAIRAEQTDHYFAKTFNLFRTNQLQNRLRGKLKRTVDKYLPESE